jgi:hypothetical protein
MLVLIIYKLGTVGKIEKLGLVGQGDEQCGPWKDTDPRRFKLRSRPTWQ